MQKLENGKIYLGHTYNATYIGRYSEEEKSLKNVWGINIQGENIQVIPAMHPVYLHKKFEDALIEVDILVEKFIIISDPDKLSFGEDLIKVFTQASTGIVTEAKNTPKMSDEEIAEKIKKATEENQTKEKNGKIIQ